MSSPQEPGLYRVWLADGRPFPEAVVRWTGSMWRYTRGWPCCRYLARWISRRERFDPHRIVPDYRMVVRVREGKLPDPEWERVP